MQSANYDSPVTVQGNASGEAMPVTLAGTTGTSATQVQGTAATDAAVVGNPLLSGGRASSATPTSVSTDGDTAPVWLSLSGAVMVAGSGTAGADGESNTAAFIRTASGGSGGLRVQPVVFNGTTWDRLRGDSTYGMKVQTLQGLSASAVFTPAAASHVAGDVHGGAQTFDLNAPASSVFEIQSASLLIAGGTIETTAWELHLFSVTPPSALADDGAFTLASGDHASYLGFVALNQVVDYGDALYIESNNVGKRVQLAASGDLFAYLVNRTTLTPQAVAHTVKIVGRPV